MNVYINLVYIFSAALFIIGLKMLNSPKTARRGNWISSAGMLIAVGVTLLDQNILSFQWIAVGLVVGSLIGVLGARRVAMTNMPEMVALLNGFGGIASLLVGWGVYVQTPALEKFTAITIYLAVLIGGVTFSGSLIAWGKLKGLVTGKPVLYTGQHIVNALLLVALLVAGVLFVQNPAASQTIFWVIMALSILLGILTVIPIGGADMPVAIALLNSYSGLAACAAGFVILNLIPIVAGALVGASGLILTRLMCKAMNRSLANVLFSGFGSVAKKAKGVGYQGEAKSATPEDAYYVLEAASSVIIVPGYGMAVAQAQHVVRELADLLEENGAEVKFAIHPVAGRMPGHMNVLLAEANVPYEQLVEMDEINPLIPSVDVAMVIGANDVVNPAAREEEDSPIYGMPIINVDQARSVFVLKRSMASGFAGIDNPLFFKENTRMVFGDAKQTLQSLVSEFKD